MAAWRRDWKKGRGQLAGGALQHGSEGVGCPPQPADYHGNAAAEVAVFHPDNGVWFVQNGATTAWGTRW
jgi:hypothetical protein